MELSQLLTYDALRTVADITIVTVLVYRALLFIRGTRAAPMLSGLTAIVLLYLLAKPLGLVTLSWILNNFLSSLLLVIVVIFQDEIRRGLTKVGLQPLFGRTIKKVLDQTLEDLALCCTKLSRARLGALIVLQREVGLEEFVQDAVAVDALVNRKLLYSIFLKESPLHDGAVLVDGDRIKAAGCVLPLSFNPDLDPNLGTRHRAALGLSERSDAVVLVVSEENGSISIVQDGAMIRNLDDSSLREELQRCMSAPKRTPEVPAEDHEGSRT